MSKINSAVDTLNQYLAGVDHTITDQVREAVDIYIQACREVNSKLSECRNLMAAGLYLDAVKTANDMTPSLSCRVKLLLLPEDKLAQLKELVKLYNLPPLVELELDVLEKLESSESNQNTNVNTLILRWRKIARTGTDIEKIKLLRDIIRNVPEDDQIWRSNLQSVERQWVKNMLSEADEALAADDGKQLEILCNALCDPELLNPPAAELLKKYQPCIEKYQFKVLMQDVESARAKLFAAYSAMDINQISHHLREYDLLISNPLYKSDDAAERAVAEVRSYLEQQLAAIENEQLYKRKLAELTAALDNHADYECVENLYAVLRQTDLPIDQRLNVRVANRREEYMQECSRRHTRRCIFGVLGGILLLAVGFMTFVAIQRFHSYRDYRKSMEELLQQGNYSGVIELHKKIADTTPLLLQFGKLSALRLEAEKKLQEENTRYNKLSTLFDQSEKELMKASPDLQQLRKLQDEIKKLSAAAIPPELGNRQLKVSFAVQQQEFKQQQQADKEFNDLINQAMRKLEKYENILKSKDADYAQMAFEVKKTLQSMERSAKDFSNVTAKLKNSRMELLRSRAGALQQQIDLSEQRTLLLKRLDAPQSFVEYTETLEKLPAAAPDLASGKYRTVLQNLQAISILNSAAALGSNISSRKELDTILQQHKLNLRSSCFVSDLTRILPDSNLSDRIKRYSEQLKNDFFDLYNCYELVFSAEDKSIWRFYSTDKPLIDRQRTSRIPKALALNVIVSPGSSGKFLPFRVNSTGAGKVVFYPGKFEGVSLPERFVKLENMPITTTLFPKALHSKLLQQILHELNSAIDADSLNNAVKKGIALLKKEKNGNIFARAALMRRLLEIVPISSDFYIPAVNILCVELDKIAIQLYDKWYQPTAEVEFSEQAAALQKLFDSVNYENLYSARVISESLHRRALERGVTAGGIVRKTADGKAKLHYFAAAAGCDEVWIYHAGNGTDKPAGFTAYKSKDNLGIILNDLPHGSVFFVPFDNLDTRKLADGFIQLNRKTGAGEIIWPASWPLNCR